MNFLKKINISTKIVLASSLLAALFLSASLFLFLSDIKTIFPRSIIRDYVDIVEIHSKEITLYLDNVISDLNLIKDSHSMESILEYDREKFDRKKFEDEFMMAHRVFYEIMSSRKMYDQIRYIDEDGYDPQWKTEAANTYLVSVALSPLCTL